MGTSLVGVRFQGRGFADGRPAKKANAMSDNCKIPAEKKLDPAAVLLLREEQQRLGYLGMTGRAPPGMTYEAAIGRWWEIEYQLRHEPARRPFDVTFELQRGERFFDMARRGQP